MTLPGYAPWSRVMTASPSSTAELPSRPPPANPFDRGVDVAVTRHTLSVLVENKPGVLARVSSLFSRRGFNIHSLAVGPTENPEVSRMTIVVAVEGLPLEQVTDDVQLLELAGQPVWLVEGDERNLKVTTRMDLRVAEMVVGEKPESRIQ